MNLIHLFYLIVVAIAATAKCNAEADDRSVLRLSGSGLDVGKEKANTKESQNRAVEVGTSRLLQLISINTGCDCDDDEDDNTEDDNTEDDNTDDDNTDDVLSHAPSPTATTPNPTLPNDVLSHAPSPTATTPNPTLPMFVASSYFKQCSLTDNLVIFGSSDAAYLFDLNYNEIKEITSVGDVEDGRFGDSVSMDYKIVVGGGHRAENAQVFSLNGEHERTILCDYCDRLGAHVATHGYKIVVSGAKKDSWTEDGLFIYTIDGELLKELFENGWDALIVRRIAMTNEVIVSTFYGWRNGSNHEYWVETTFIYSNTGPDYDKIAEINKGGAIAVSGNKIAIRDVGDSRTVWIYLTDGTLVKTLDAQDATGNLRFGWSIALIDDKVLIGAVPDDDEDDDHYSYYSSLKYESVLIYSAITGDFIEEIMDPNGDNWYDSFGDILCASDSHYVVGSSSEAYLFPNTS